MKKILYIVLLIPLIGAGVTFATWTGSHGSTPVHKAGEYRQQVQGAADVRTSEIPARVTIPKLGVSASVESVGMDSKGRMDVPKNVDNVAWYELGYKPGDKGNAVIAGHFDKVSGAPAVFYNIEKLQNGDKIVITDIRGNENTFSVNRTTRYPYDKFPLQQVFGASTKRMLNLITCEGQWNNKTHNYSHRTVVYAEMVE